MVLFCSSALAALSFRLDVASIRHRKILTRTSPSDNCEQYMYEFGIKTVEFMFAGINLLWARLRLILARTVQRGLTVWALGMAQNIFKSKNINCITTIITLEGFRKIKTKKTNMTTKQRAFTTWMAFIFPQWKYTIERSWLKLQNLALWVVKICKRHER